MKRKKLLVVILFFAAVSFSLCACASPKTDGSYYEFTDSLGFKVTLDSEPSRVAVLFSSFADVWTIAGGNVDITVRESVERGFSDQNAILVDSGAGKTINREALLAASPDFVISSADISAQVSEAAFFRSIGIPSACLRVDDLTDYLNMLRICSDITGNSDAYETYGNRVKERADELILSAAELEHKNILFIRCGSSYGATKAKTASDNFVCAMLKELNTFNIAENAPALTDGLSIEEILSQDPDRIFISTMGNEQAAKAYMDGVLSGSLWQSLTAIKNGKYSYLPKELFQFKPNSRWAEAYEYLIDLLK